MSEPQHPPAKPTLMIDNEQVRVTEWRFAPGEATGHHTHEYNYVVIPTQGGCLRIKLPNGSDVSADLVIGQPYYRDKGVEHDVINAADHEIAFIEVEIKDR